MQPSRRTVLGVIGASVLPMSAGCTGSTPGTNGSERTTESTVTGDGAAFEVRLHGPETDRLLFDGTDVANVGPVETTSAGMVSFPIALTEEATADVGETFRSLGVTENPDRFEIVQTYAGEEKGRFDISPSLATDIADGEWEGKFLLSFKRREQATEVRQTLVTSESA